MKKIALLFILLTHFLRPVTAQVPQQLADRFQFVVDSISTKYNIKGVSTAVLIPGMGTWKGTNGYSHAGVKLTPEMLFCMGSNTKTFFAALLLKLQEQGKINLDDSIGKWIQGYPNINGQATIRQCLNHTTGVAEYFANAAINDSIFSKPSKIWTEDEILRMAGTPDFALGKSWSYSNTGYIIIGKIIKAVLQKSQFTALDETILKPNGLTNTYNFGEQPQSMVYAHPWTMNLTGNSLTDITTSPYLNQLFNLAITAGGLMTTAEENVNFWNKLFTGQIISNDSWKQMTTMVKVNSNMEYGLGIMRMRNSNNRVVYSHGGTFFGFLHENMVDTLNGVCISVLSNQDSLNNGGLQAFYVANLHKEVLNSGLLGVEKATSKNFNVSVYPNPVADFLHIDFEDAHENVIAALYDMNGRKVLSEEIYTQMLNVADLPEGIYVLRLSNGRNGILQTQKVVVKH